MTARGNLTRREAEQLQAKGRRELERRAAAELRRRDRERLAALRAAIRTAREARRQRIREARELCKSARAKLRARVAAAREALRAAREALRAAPQTCATNLERARVLEAYNAARDALAIELAKRSADRARKREERQDARIWNRDRKLSTRAERRAESDDEVRNNLPPELVPLWEQRKGKIKASRLRSRTEAFLEWVHDHPGAVAELHAKAEAAELARLERAELEHYRETRKAGRYRRAARILEDEGIPF